MATGIADSVTWLAGLSPWPADGFGLERMRELLAALGDPQGCYPAVHVVGTNGKSTATVTIEELLRADRLMKASGVSNEALLEGWLLGQMARAGAAA